MSITLNDCGPAHEADNLHPSAGADYSAPVREASHLNSGGTTYNSPAHGASSHPGGGSSDAESLSDGASPGTPGPNGADGIRGSAPIFSALGDKTRLALVARLCTGGPLSIARLTAGADITRQAITKHLNILAGAGLVRDIRVGRERLWEVETRQLEEARRALERISTQWDDSLARLKLAVENDGH